VVAALVLSTSACATLGQQVDQVQERLDGAAEDVGDIGDRARFCFAITRALTGLDGGSSPEEARDAAEEVLAQVPDELRDDAELVADALRTAEETGDDGVLREARFREAAERLRADTRALCDPS
jgi:DNA-binding ferritin-like protein